MMETMADEFKGIIRLTITAESETAGMTDKDGSGYSGGEAGGLR